MGTIIPFANRSGQELQRDDGGALTFIALVGQALNRTEQILGDSRRMKYVVEQRQQL